MEASKGRKKAYTSAFFVLHNKGTAVVPLQKEQRCGVLETRVADLGFETGSIGVGSRDARALVYGTW